MLSMPYREEYTHGFNLRPDPIGRALAAARRAVDAAPANHLAYHALTSALFFRRELGAFRTAAERALALNAMDGFTAAYLGFQITYAVSATTKARWTLSSKSTCPPFGERTSRLPQRARNSANAMPPAMRSGSS